MFSTKKTELGEIIGMQRSNFQGLILIVGGTRCWLARMDRVLEMLREP